MFLSSLQSLGANSSDYTAILSTNTIKIASKMELFIILATLENFEC